MDFKVRVQLGNRIYTLPQQFVKASTMLTDVVTDINSNSVIPLPDFNNDTRTIFPSYKQSTKTKDMNYKIFKDACGDGDGCDGCDKCDSDDERLGEHYRSMYNYIQLPIDWYEFIIKHNIYPERDDYFGEMIDITLSFLNSPQEERKFCGSRKDFYFSFTTCPGFITDNFHKHWDNQLEQWVDEPPITDLIPFVDFTRLMWMWSYLNIQELYDYGFNLIMNIAPMGRHTVQLHKDWSLPSDVLPREQIEKRWIKAGGSLDNIDLDTLAKYNYKYNFRTMDEFLSEEYLKSKKFDLDHEWFEEHLNKKNEFYLSTLN